MSFIQSLKQPFPFDPRLKTKLGIAAFFGGFIFVFLVIFKPFQLNLFAAQKLIIIELAYALITFSCVFVSIAVLPRLFPTLINESVWTTGREIIFTAIVIFFVGLINYLLSPFLVQTKLNLSAFLWFQGITVLTALMPVSIFILLKQNRLLKKFSRQAEIIEKKLQEKQEVMEKKEEPEDKKIMTDKIILLGDYQNEKVEVYASDLYLVTSASNYIKLFHLQKEKLVYSIIRSTLKKAEETLLAYPNFFKCHRAYLINLDKVVRVEGNAQGYKIKVEGHDEFIPVSRNLNSEFSDKLLAFRKQHS